MLPFYKAIDRNCAQNFGIFSELQIDIAKITFLIILYSFSKLLLSTSYFKFKDEVLTEVQ